MDCIEKLFKDKTIKDLQIDGFGITLITNDNLELNYDASDGGYSSWEITKNGKEI